MTFRNYFKLIFCFFVGLIYRFYLSVSHPRVRVLVFHQIDNMGRFETLIDALSKDILWISVSEFEDFLSGRVRLPQHAMLVTFDDGLYSQFRAAQTVLKPRGIKAHFFINPPFISMDTEKAISFIHENMRVPDYAILPDQPRENMNWEDVNTLISEGHTIGSHSQTHIDLGKVLSQEVIEFEFCQSAQDILKNTGHLPRHFAIPFGRISMITKANIRKLLKQYGYVHTSVRGADDHFQRVIFRETINPTDPLFYSYLVSRGILSWMYFGIRRRMIKWVV